MLRKKEQIGRKLNETLHFKFTIRLLLILKKAPYFCTCLPPASFQTNLNEDRKYHKHKKPQSEF